MDEPQLTSQVDETDASADKSDLRDVLDSAFSGGDFEKPMEVDEPLGDEPSTSVEAAASEAPVDSVDPPEKLPVEPEIEDAGKVDEVEDVSMVEPSEADKTGSELDETAQPVDFTEQSINISQLNVEQQNDDSNDAFNALKEAETDALEGSRAESEEPDEVKQEPVDEPEEITEPVEVEKSPASEETTDPMEVSNSPELEVAEQPVEVDSVDVDVEKSVETVETEKPSIEETLDDTEDQAVPSIDEPIESPSEAPIAIETVSSPADEPIEDIADDPVDEAQPATPVEAPMETDDVPDGEEDADDSTTADKSPDQPAEESREISTETVDLDDSEIGDMGPPRSVERTENEDLEELPDDISAEATNEGEGVDENVCLLGDETEIGDADKDSAGQSEDAVEDEEIEIDSPALEKEAENEAGSDVIEVDSEIAEAAPEGEEEEEEPAEIEEEEPAEDAQEPIAPLKENEIREVSGENLDDQTCLNCENSTKCLYQMLEDSGEIKFLCAFNCVKEHREDNPDKYSLTQKVVTISEIPPAEQACSKCSETKSCKYRYKVPVFSTVTKEPPPPVEGEELPEEPPQPTTETVRNIEARFLCEDSCLKEFIGDNTEKYVVKEVKRRSARVKEVPKRLHIEEQQGEPPQEDQEIPKIVARSDAEVEAARIDRDQSFMRRCGQCFLIVNFGSKTIQWETMDFCNEKCLGQYQSLIGAACIYCNQVVPLAAMGKLCVRFGPEIRQFCTTACLNSFKKDHLPCGFCSKNLNNEVDESPLKRGNNSFCNEECAKGYESIVSPKKRQPPYMCSVCNHKKAPKILVLLDDYVHRFCSTPCFSAFKFVNNVVPDQCDLCTKYFERKSNDAHTIYQGSDPKIFCSRNCISVYISKSREILQCNWCKVSKYNYDMIQLNHGSKKICSLNCLSLSEVSTNALARKRSKCDHCKIQKQPQYHLTMTDSSIRNFCTYQCVLGFQSVFTKARIAGDILDVVPAGTAKRIMPAQHQPLPSLSKQPVIAHVQSLNPRPRGRPPGIRRTSSPIPVPELRVQLERLTDVPQRVKVSSFGSYGSSSSSWTPAPQVRTEHKTQVVTIPPLPKTISNKSTMCKALTLNKGINAQPMTAEAECQTDDWLENRMVVPVPIPIYIPQPMYMYNLPTPIPVPIPLPIPVPIFVPTTRNSASGIMKEIKKIQEKMPTDPYEAELLMMAEMVAGDKKREETDSDSDENNDMEYGDGIENNSSFNEDLVQMAFKMASGNDFDDPPVDLENEMTANTISQSTNAYGEEIDPHSLQHHQLLLLQQQREAAMQANRNRKRMQPVPTKPTNNQRNNIPSKRIKREMEVLQPEMPREPAEKPDANMCLKYTFGVNAWKQWVATKNADLEKSSIRRKPIKSEILQLTADELNYSLCMFVKEVRKPNGSEYAPDTIYYLVLGIQQYLYENGRIDNIFTDRYYEQFTDCLDEVAKKFSVLYNDSQYIVTRVEEEHLWECKQLGAHSPHVLLSTLMFFNTKHFNLVTVDEHMELSFSHIMKHWKRNPNQPGAAKVPGSRNVLLRFYPPQSSLEANSRKKKVYEQQENEENPLRCPVKLYEFYLSKCPESVKTRNDVFYLQPERSCVPDSPVWYSTQPLSRDALSKMLHRVKMVKEINIALLTS